MHARTRPRTHARFLLHAAQKSLHAMKRDTWPVVSRRCRGPTHPPKRSPQPQSADPGDRGTKPAARARTNAPSGEK
eukprot:5499015-Alexandrium_andersonii.AAC.1